MARGVCCRSFPASLCGCRPKSCLRYPYSSLCHHVYCIAYRSSLSTIHQVILIERIFVVYIVIATKSQRRSVFHCCVSSLSFLLPFSYGVFSHVGFSESQIYPPWTTFSVLSSTTKSITIPTPGSAYPPRPRTCSKACCRGTLQRGSLHRR